MASSLDGKKIVVVEDDPSVAKFILFVLDSKTQATVVHYPAADEALAALATDAVDLVLTDVRLPGMTGLEFIRALRAITEDVPVVVMTAHATVDLAVEAMQLDAEGLLEKPIGPEALIEQLELALSRRRDRRPKRTVLAIGAHPDDVEIGVGATLLRHAAEGDEVSILTTSRGAVGGTTDLRVEEAKAAAEIIGATLHLGDLVDTKIEEAGATVDLVEKIVGEVQPDLVYVHSVNDVHQDHRSVHRATLVGARRVPNILCYQSPSATVKFQPTRFIKIDDYIEGKLGLIAAHASQATIRGYMDPELITSTARYWGRFADTRFAEPLEIERVREGVEELVNG